MRQKKDDWLISPKLKFDLTVNLNVSKVVLGLTWFSFCGDIAIIHSYFASNSWKILI